MCSVVALDWLSFIFERGRVKMESSGGIAVEGRELEGFRIRNPFTLKVGQVFTGFGIGCGVGIGVGRPINTGAIPVLNQVMSATRGATDAFSGVRRHVNGSLRKLGAKSIEAGVGCGVGFGHGFGIGLAVKPGVVNQIQSSILQALAKMMVKFGIAPNISSAIAPLSLGSGKTMISETSSQNPVGKIMQLATRIPDHTPQVSSKKVSSPDSFAPQSSHDSFGSRTEEVISNFLQNPVLKEHDTPDELVGRLQSKNSMLQMVLKHQQVIEELMDENKKLRQILIEDLNIPASKLQASGGKDMPPCSDCFDCRRRQRRSRRGN